jgi:hypothetical protein
MFMLEIPQVKSVRKGKLTGVSGELICLAIYLTRSSLTKEAVANSLKPRPQQAW